MLNLINIFALCGVIIFLYILQILPAKSKGRNLYVVILFSSLLASLSVELLLHYDVISIRLFSAIAVSAVINYGPALYGYIRVLNNNPMKRIVWHFIPYQMGLILIWILILAGIEVPQWFYSSYYTGILSVYCYLAVRTINTNPSPKHSDWIKTVGFGFGTLVLLHVTEVILINIGLFEKIEVAKVCTAVQNVFSFSFLLILIRQVITNPSLFSNANLRVPRNTDNSVNQAQLNLLLTYVQHEKAYRNSDLKCSLVSEETGLGINEVSEIVNKAFKKNFNDWVNDYRIEEAKLLLNKPKLTIKEICYEVGFNSKSAFHSAFKKRLNQTPTHFRNSVMSTES